MIYVAFYVYILQRNFKEKIKNIKKKDEVAENGSQSVKY